MLSQLLFKTSPQAPIGEVTTWQATEMLSQAHGGPFNPYDVAVPDIAINRIHGSVEVIAGRPTDYSFTHDETGDFDTIFPFFSGFGGVQLSSGPFAGCMARLGMPTVTVESAREDDRSLWERLTNPHALQVEIMEAVLEDLQAQTGIDISPTGTITIPVGHSMGGEPALRYAERNHRTTGAVVLLATIGFGSPNLLKIAQKVPLGTPTAIREEVIPFIRSDEVDLSLGGAYKAVRYHFANPARTVGEIGSCLTSRQTERVHCLRELGIPTVYGQPVYDLLVQGIDGARSAVDVVGEIERAGHMFVQAKPGRASHWVLDAVNTIELAKAS